MFEIVVFDNGTASLKPAGGGEPMHSSIGPMDEAREVYVVQIALRERLMVGAGSEPFTLYDAGLGIAANTIAALEAAAALPNRARSLRIVSFENAPDGLAHALARPKLFPHLAPWTDAARALLAGETWKDGARGLSWELRRGDFRDEICHAPLADAVFYDFYSPRTSPELWTRECFAKLRRRVREPENGRSGPIVVTYLASTAARAAMLGAGFWVAAGTPTARKAETTLIALRREDLPRPPLGRSWLEKLARSPSADAVMHLAAHPQFAPAATSTPTTAPA